MKLSVKLKARAQQLDQRPVDHNSLIRIAELVERLEHAVALGIDGISGFIENRHDHPEIEFASYLDDMRNALECATGHPKQEQ